MNVNYNDYHQQTTTCTFYIYKKQKYFRNVYIYTRIQTLFKKQDNLRYDFIHKNPDTLRYAIFHEFFEIGIYIDTKSMTLCVTWRFYIQEARYIEKIRTICVTFFTIQKEWHFTLRNFSWNFLNWRRGSLTKNNSLCIKF